MFNSLVFTDIKRGGDMKKFIVSLLGIFLLFGAGILSACGKSNPTMTLSSDTVAIQLYSQDEESSKTITANLSGVKEGSIKASAVSGYENIIDVSTTRLSSTKFSIKIDGLEEGDAEIIVRGTPGNIVKKIQVNVFSEVSAMSQKEEEQIRKNNFLIRGVNNELVETKLISFEPSDKSRRTITWSLSSEMADVKGLTLEGNSIFVDDEFGGEEVDLVATTEKGVTANIKLPVINKIEKDITLAFSYSQNTSFEEINEDNNEFNIVPNIPYVDQYQGYISVDYNGELDITPYVLNKNGRPTEDIQVLRHGTFDNKPLFIVYASKDKSNINDDYVIGFEIGYKNFNYFVDTIDTTPIKIKAREMVNGITLSTEGVTDVSNTVQTLYTTYVDGSNTSVNGQKFNVSITPTTVIDATNKYSIRISRSTPGGAVADGCPVEVWYRDEKNGNVWTQAILQENPDNGDFFTNDANLLSAKTVYLKASSTLKEQVVSGYNITFTSQDNSLVSTTFNLRLVKSATLNDFGFNNADFRVDSSKNQETYTRQLTLKGQTTIDGLSIINSGKYVEFKQITEVSHNEESVTFEVSFILLDSSYGVTTHDSYQIVHKNGLASNNYDIDIFLPLKDSAMYVDMINEDTGEYSSNSVIDSELSKFVYDINGTILQGRYQDSLSKLIVKNNKTTPIRYSYNQINGISAVANIAVGFFDFDPKKMALDEFKRLMQSEDGATRVVRSALAGGNNSNIAYFTADHKSIITKGVGHTYAVVSFSGKGVDNVDENGNVTYIRVIYIESMVVPEGMNVYPDANKNITLYSNDTVSDEDRDLTKQRIDIKFAKDGITYKNISNLKFITNDKTMGSQNQSGDGKVITWQNGRYGLDQISITDEGISFYISAITTFDSHIFKDTLFIHYSIFDDNGDLLYDISDFVNITIKNAQRVERLRLKSYDSDGIYFEVGDDSVQYILLETSPTDSKNKNIANILTDENGNILNFLNVSDSVSSDTLAINLASSIKNGMTGYIYLLPADAMYGGQIKYYYEDGGEQTGYVSLNDLPKEYDNIVNKGYFKSNTLNNETKKVNFADILIKIKVNVADGLSFEHAYRIYNNDSFVSMRPDRYYTIMNNLDLSDVDRSVISSFAGGLQGVNENITIKLDGKNFAQTIAENAIIRNITFIGDVKASGFVCDTNNGSISNVTVDVNGRKASTLVSTTNAGGIAGINNGLIDGAKVLGLTIKGDKNGLDDGNVGGIAGVNNGTISKSKVEFYNLVAVDENGEPTFDENDNPLYAVNTFTGINVGGIVGKITGNGVIRDSYAYDYTMEIESRDKTARVLNAHNKDAYIGKVGAFAGNYEGNGFTISNSFSVVNIEEAVAGLNLADNKDRINEAYISYFNGTEYYSRWIGTSLNQISEGEGFYSYVNGGQAHLIDLRQDEFVKNVNYNVADFDVNGFYKSLKVNENSGILFNYALKNESADLTSSEEKDLRALNTISLTDLIKEDKNTFNYNIVVSSSDSSIVKVVGSDLQILRTGDVTITLASKHDVSLLKEIKIKVLYALSEIVLTWVDSAGKVESVVDNSIISLQKTRSRDFVANFENSQVYIGSLSTAYEIKQDENLNLDIIVASTNQGEDENVVSITNNSVSGFKVLTNDTSVSSRLNVSPKLFNKSETEGEGSSAQLNKAIQNALKEKFNRQFTILPIEGVITFDISNKNLPITPSVNASQRVEIKTTDESDIVYPVISFDGEELEASTDANDNYIYYTLVGENKPIFKVSVNKIAGNGTSDNSDTSGLRTYVYDVVFEIDSAYRPNVSQDMDFEVFFMSRSGNSSEEWGGIFTLNLTRQKFNNIDVSNKKIFHTTYQYDGLSTIVEVHETDKETSVLAPGNSSILQVNVNPEYAYYDYVDLSYSNATVSEAVNIEVMEKFGESSNLFKRKSIEGNNIDKVGSVLRYYPKAEEKGTLYYKLWINSTVNRDSTLMFTAKFCDNSGKVLHYVNYFMTISYLTEPTITIDGSNTAYLAKGASSQVKIEVLADQRIDNLTLSGKGIEGVELSSYGRPVLDPVKGINTYTAILYAYPNAEAESDTIYINAQVSRELNGSKEIKEVVSTAVLVDFKVDPEQISINGKDEKAITIWQGVPKSINFEYNLIPEDYGVAPTPEIEEAISELRQKRDIFTGAQYYPAKVEKTENGIEYSAIDEKDMKNYKYFVNYQYDKYGKLHMKNLRDRLSIVSGNNCYPITDESVEKPFDFNFDESTNTISFTGTKINTSIVLALKTYISAGDVTHEYETLFTVNIDAYSDPDLPLLIKNAGDFKKLDPANAGEGATAHDYILTNDIILENFIPFDTGLINSFDGNGHTIYLKSFNLELSDTTALNLALFSSVTENTILKNVRVNFYNGGQITVDTFKYKEIKIAGLAIENSGVITNCEVVSYYTDASAVTEVDNLYDNATIKHNNPSGINVKYTNGKNDEPIYLHDDDNWSSEIAGLVISNNGSITNSRVGGDDIIIIGEERIVNGIHTGETYATHQKLDTFNIIGQGNMAGFVLNNTNGNIASSFVKQLDMENQSDSTLYYASGFVGINNSTINVSYIEGMPSDENDPTIGKYSAFAYEGTSIKSKKGCIVGFVYRNEGRINDCYSNILISNNDSESSVYLASGFVYENMGTIENGYSASQIQNLRGTQMNFSGVNRKGELLVEGEYINCYFFNKQYEDTEENSDNTTETLNNTGAVLIPTPDKESLFYGFAIANSDNDGIWKVEKDKGIFLISTDFVSVSHRYIYYIESDNFEGVAGEDEKGKYILPYSTLSFTETSVKIDTSLGGAFNPIIISDAEDFVSVSGTSTSSYIKEYFNSTAMWGTYRIVDNINLSDIASGDNVTVLPSSSKAFAGTLYGNGFTISGLSLATEERAVALGLFRSIERRGKLGQPVVKNLNISLIQVDGSVITMVGALAGYIKDAVVVSIDVAFEQGAGLYGYNFAGSLAGFAIGDNTIKGVKVYNPNVTARAYLSDNITDENYFISDEINKGPRSLQALRTDVENNLNYNTGYSSSLIASLVNYSYAGGVIGFVDNYRVNLPAFDYNQANNFNIKNIRVNGQVYIEGQVVGGVFGLTGYQTTIRDVGIIIDSNSDSHIIAKKYFAGGVIGQSFGSLNRIFAVHDDATQDKIENNMAKFYGGDTSAPRGILDLFYFEGKNYTQRYIGGLVGVAYSGSMVVSYSRLNVTSPTTDYAGGIIGGLKLQDTASFQVTVYEGHDFYTKYYMNEVYATGDVRSKAVKAEQVDDLTYAGGIVGQIVGEASRVVMMSVNAFNYITTYDYETKSYTAINPGQDNLSQIYRVNSLVGQFAKVVDGNIVLDKVEKDNSTSFDPYTSYLNLVRCLDKTDGDRTEKYVPSIGVYSSYYLNNLNNPVTLNLFGSYDAKDEIEKAGLGKCFYFVESPRSFTSSLVGNQYTTSGFLGSGVWKIENWEHDITKLFPTIKYKRTSDILYLDQYNIEEVFRKMQGSNATVYIRGLESKGSENYGDIRLDKFYKNGNTIKINNFGGKLVGGKYPQDDEADKIKIISDQNFITSVFQGFKVEDVTVEYYKESGKIEVKNNDGSSDTEFGLFVNGTMNVCEISNLTLQINSPVEFVIEPKAGKDVYVGLIAPRILNSQISFPNITSKITSGYLMTIKGDNVDIENDSLYAGLIAGQAKLTKDNSLKNMNVKISELNLKCDLMTVSAQYKNYYVGSYFGNIEKETGVPYLLNTVVSSIKRDDTNIVGAGNPTIFISGNEKANINLGGYFGCIAASGDASPINNLQQSSGADGGDLSTSINFKVKVANNLNVGGLFGRICGTNGSKGLSFNASAIMDATLFVEEIVSTEEKVDRNGELNAGALVGLQEGNFGVSGYKAIDFGVMGNRDDVNDAKFLSRKNDFAGNYNEYSGLNINPVVVAGTANVGGVVGNSLASLTVKFDGTTLNALGENNNESKTKANESNKINNIRVKAKNAFLGGVVGYAQSNELTIEGSMTSNTEFNLSDNTNANPYIVGGIVGGIYYAGDSSQTDAPPVKVNIDGGESKIMRFDGAVYSNIKNLVFGGAVGQVQFANANDKLIINNTSFGGVIKVYGEYALSAGNVTTGGTIGKVSNNNSINTVGNVSMISNFNYGDVFVEYPEPEWGVLAYELKSYTFGGLIGTVASSVNYNINSNYSIMTTHNSKYSDTKSTVNALFGSGVPTAKNNSNSIVADNYYNHAVALANDENGTDIAYNNSTGYLGYKNSGSSSYFLSQDVRGKLGDNYQNISKLNPGNISKTSELTETPLFNGMRYYVIKEHVKNSGYIVDYKNDEINTIAEEDKKGNTDLKNVAIIGDGQNIVYELDDKDTDLSAMIKSLSGHSFVSGIALEVKVSKEFEFDRGTYISTLVNEMFDNSIVYAINTRGSLDVGGTNAFNVSGIVGNLYSGKIFDCSTDLDITYRAGKADPSDNVFLKNTDGGCVLGITYAYFSPETNQPRPIVRLIENTYSAGSIKTMVDAPVFAFTLACYANVNNCYSITKVDLNNYLELESKYTISDFNVESDGPSDTHGLINCYVDHDALNDGWATRGKTHTQFWNVITEGEDKGKPNPSGNFSNSTNKWECDYDFNYGYPTLKYQYMKNSSYAYLSKTETKLARLKSEKRAYEGYDPNKDEENNDINLYDNYIVENEYTRLSNGKTPATEDDCYYMIPNIAILSKLKEVNKNFYLNKDKETENINGKFILKYDIDVNNRAKEESEYTEKSLGNFTGIFDGQEKTIKGLTKTLFNSIVGTTTTANAGGQNYTSGIVRNLRLTEANLDGKKALLADSITNGLISNMTISGDFKGSYSDDNLNVGGLVATATNTEINTVTNMLNMNVSSDEDINAGGLVGKMTDSSKMLFCSNYGPTNVRSSVSEKNIRLGGLVGTLGETVTKEKANEPAPEIKYSFNATSVLGNYASNNKVSTTTGIFYTGGLVGELKNGTISNSYNSGMVKSGNKNNGQSGSGKLSYAGGIAGIINGGQVNTCYNEGTIEALGTNPTTEWRFDDTEETFNKDGWNTVTQYSDDDGQKKINDSPGIELCQTSERNVYAYGIGYNKAGKVLDSSIRLLRNNNDNPDELTIISNGSGDPGVLFERTWNDVFNTPKLKNLFNDWVTTSFHADAEFRSVHVWYFLLIGTGTTTGWVRHRIQYNFKLEQISIETSSKDWLDVPTAYVVKFEVHHDSSVRRVFQKIDQVNCFTPQSTTNFYYGYTLDGEGSYTSLTDDRKNHLVSEVATKHKAWDIQARFNSNAGTTNIKYDYYSGGYIGVDYQKKFYSDEKNKITGKDADEKNKITGKDADGITTDSNSNIKQACRSQEVQSQDINKLKIAGKVYFIADHNNADKVFETGIISDVNTIETKLPYNPDKGYYKLTSTDDRVGVFITNVSEYKDKNMNSFAKIEYKYFTDGDNLKNSSIAFSVNVEFNYQQKIDLSLQDMKYYYNDEYSIELEIEGIEYLFTAMDGYTLTYNEESSQNPPSGRKVVRLSTEEINSDSGLMPDDGKFIYLFYEVDENGNPIKKDRYVFAPNANIKTTDYDKDFKVNRVEVGGGQTLISLTIDKLKELQDKSLYLRQISRESKYVECSFKSQYAEYSFDSNSVLTDIEGGSLPDGIKISYENGELTIGKTGIDRYVEVEYTKKDDDNVTTERKLLAADSSVINLDQISSDSTVTIKFYPYYQFKSQNESEIHDYWVAFEDGIHVNAVLSYDKNDYKTEITQAYKKIGDLWIKVVSTPIYEEQLVGIAYEYYCDDSIFMRKEVRNDGTFYHNYYNKQGEYIKAMSYFLLSEQGDSINVEQLGQNVRGFISGTGNDEKFYSEKKEDSTDLNRYYIKDNKKYTLEIGTDGQYLQNVNDSNEKIYDITYVDYFENVIGNNGKTYEISDKINGIYQDQSDTTKTYTLVSKESLSNTAEPSIVYIPNVNAENNSSDKTIEIEYKNLPQIENYIDKFGVFKEIVQGGTITSYVYVKGALQSLDEDCPAFKSESNIVGGKKVADENFVSKVKVPTILYNEFKIPKYQNVEFELDYMGMTFTDEEGNYSLDDHCCYTVEGKKYSIYLRKDTDYISFTATKSGKEESKEVIIEETNDSAIDGIILTQDITFNKSGLAKKGNAKIIGNGYFISYYDTPFYAGITDGNGFINNTSFLGETYGNSVFFIDQNNSKNTLSNISLYGSLVNHKGSNSAIINNKTNKKDVKPNLAINNLQMHISINSIANRYGDEVLTLINQTSSYNHNGILVLADGEDGKKKSNSGKNGLGLQDTTLVNSGILIQGQGGNALAHSQEGNSGSLTTTSAAGAVGNVRITGNNTILIRRRYSGGGQYYNRDSFSLSINDKLSMTGGDVWATKKLFIGSTQLAEFDTLYIANEYSLFKYNGGYPDYGFNLDLNGDLVKVLKVYDKYTKSEKPASMEEKMN